MAMIRLDKFLADMSIGTRSQVKKLIKEKRVVIDGEIVKKADTKIDENTIVYVDDQPVSYLRYEYYLLNKPTGYVCALEDKYYPTVMELIYSQRHDLSPVGRLDKDTVGALLITNDGKLNHNLLTPENHVKKKYYFECEPELPSDAVEILAKPIKFKDFESKPAKLEIINGNSGQLTISEGKYHQVKRMIAFLGCEVTYLRRDEFAFLDLTGLEEGQYRELTEQEVERLKELAKII